MTTETLADVVRDFDAMAAECGGLEAATIHAMTARLSAAHAREVEALRSDLSDYMQAANAEAARSDKLATKVEALRERAEAAEAALNIAHSHIDMGALHVSHYKDAAAIDAAIASGGEG